MPYNAELDVSSFKEVVNLDTTRINISVHSYNCGVNKIQITRENFVDGIWSFTKLGRMNKIEIEAVLPIIIKASEVM